MEVGDLVVALAGTARSLLSAFEWPVLGELSGCVEGCALDLTVVM